MIIKGGTLYNKPSVKTGITKQSKIVVKGGTIFSTISFKKVSTGLAGYAQKVLSIAAANVNKIIGITRTTIDNVIGAE